jgi:hypothetical protein
MANSIKENWLPKIYQSLGIIMIVAGVLAVPLKMRFNYVEARQRDFLKTLGTHYEDHKILENIIPNKDLLAVHYIDHKELVKSIPNLELLKAQYVNINEKLDSLNDQLEECRGTDKEFRKQLYEYFKIN